MSLSRQRAPIVVAVLAAVAGPILFSACKKNDNGRPEQSAEPFRIADNFYYVGTNADSVFLITGPEGHVLLDTAYSSLVAASIAKLGFRIKDVKALLISEPHSVEGMTALQQASGAELWTSEANAKILSSGGDDPDFSLPLKLVRRAGLGDAGIGGYSPARVDHPLKDGDTVRVGPIAITAHVTPGAWRGCTSWSFPVRDGGRVLHVVRACSLIRVFGMRYDGQDADLERSFRLLRSLPADIWVTGSSRRWDRYRKFLLSASAKNPVDPFIDPAGYRAYIDDAETELHTGVVH